MSTSDTICAITVRNPCPISIPDTDRLSDPSSLNFRYAALLAFAGIAGAFQKHASPFPTALDGSLGLRPFFPHPISFATASMAPRRLPGFIFAP